jgi:hypothetical protein
VVGQAVSPAKKLSSDRSRPEIWQDNCLRKEVMRAEQISKGTRASDDDYIPIPECSSWRNSEFVCALADTHRHLGHVIKKKQWHAYDATHSGGASNAFKYLGAFVDLAAAKLGVELAVWAPPGQKRSGVGHYSIN